MTKKPQIKDLFKIGITSVTLNNTRMATYKEIKQTEKELLKNVVKDQEILTILLQENNLQKIKHRFEHIISMNDNEGKLITCNTIGKTLTDVTTELNTNIPYKTRTEDFSPTLKQKLEAMQYKNIEHHRNGSIDIIKIKTIFRKTKN